MEGRKLYSQYNNFEEKMIKRNSGFTMVELLITMAIFVLTIAAASAIFVPMLTQFKQQSRIAETQIQGLVGLDALRWDLEHAGYGLPWVIPAIVAYNEASSATTSPLPAPNIYNDCSGTAPCNPPRPVLSDNNVAGLGGSDYLVIKSASVSTNDAAGKWTYITGTSGGGNTVHLWGTVQEDLEAGDRVTVIRPMMGEETQRILRNNGSIFFTSFNTTSLDNAFSPDPGDSYLVYGIDPDTDLRMPFSRADYYISSTTTIPPRCASGTGVLTKSVIRQADGNRGPGMPLLDCVADLQVAYGIDIDGDGDFELGSGDGYTDDISAMTADEIWDQVKEIRVYILAHEGQKDVNYEYPSSSIDIPPTGDPAYGSGRTFDLTTITDWENYRWKLYTIVTKINKMMR